MPLFNSTNLSDTFDVWVGNTNNIVEAINTLFTAKAGIGVGDSGNATYPNIQAYDLDVYRNVNIEGTTRFVGDVDISSAYVIDNLYFSDTTPNKDSALNPKIYATNQTDLEISTGSNSISVKNTTNSVDISSGSLSLGTTNIRSDDLDIIVDSETINIDTLASGDGDYSSPLNDDLSGKLALTLPDDGVLKFGSVAIRTKADKTLEFNPDITDATKTWDALGGGGSGSSAIEYKNTTSGVVIPASEGGPVNIDYLLTVPVGTPVAISLDSVNNQMEYVGASANFTTPNTKVGILTEKTQIGSSSSYDLGVTFLGNFTFNTSNAIFQTGESPVALGNDYFVSSTEVGKVSSDEPTNISDFAFRIVGLDGTTATGLVMPYRPAASGKGNRLITETFVGDGVKTRYDLSYPVPSISGTNGSDYLMAFIAGVLDTEITVAYDGVSQTHYVEFDAPPPLNFEVVIRYFKDVPIAIFDSKVDRAEYGLAADTGVQTIGSNSDVGKYEVWTKEDPLVSADIFFNGTDANIITVSSTISDIKDNLATVNIYVEGGVLKVQNKTSSVVTLVAYQKL